LEFDTYKVIMAYVSLYAQHLSNLENDRTLNERIALLKKIDEGDNKSKYHQMVVELATYSA
jgi:hypothetical protein